MPRPRDTTAGRPAEGETPASRATPRRAARNAREAATSEGTSRYRSRFAEQLAADFFRPIGDAHVSSIGIGTYLGDCLPDVDASYQRAIATAFAQGINLIDTAINYRCQRSERCVGVALKEAIASGRVNRDEVVVCTKGGYVPLDGTAPSSREDYQEYVKREFIDSGVLAPHDLVGGGHAMTPTFLANQIARSRANLGLETIDLYYLHNPEQQLDAVQPARFRTMVRHAFALLEERVAAGDLRGYGCATWKGFRIPPTEKGHLSLHELVAIARDVGGDDHHFVAVQLPINLAMPEAVRVPTQQLGGRRTVTLLEAAVELGIAVVASATLMQSQLTTGLPPAVREVFPKLETDAQRAIAFTRTLPGVTSALVGMKQPAHVEENARAGSA
jgi:aryl-alcohol dehydrogenase-like predicted oxidoreductase